MCSNPVSCVQQCIAKLCAESALIVHCTYGCDQPSSLRAERLAGRQCRLMKVCLGFPGAAVPWSFACGRLAGLCPSCSPSKKAQPYVNQAAVACGRYLCAASEQAAQFLTQLFARVLICQRHLSFHACALCMLGMRMHQLWQVCWNPTWW